MMSEVKQDLYYIQDTRSYTGNSVTWWCTDGHGYTTDLAKAWRVTKETAEDICSDRKTDVMWRCDEVDSLAQLHFDMQNLR